MKLLGNTQYIKKNKKSITLKYYFYLILVISSLLGVLLSLMVNKSYL